MNYIDTTKNFNSGFVDPIGGAVGYTNCISAEG